MTIGPFELYMFPLDKTSYGSGDFNCDNISQQISRQAQI